METKEKKQINIEDFFTEDNERAGVWFEPKIDGNPCGIEFLVTGASTDDNIIEAIQLQTVPVLLFLLAQVH